MEIPAGKVEDISGNLTMYGNIKKKLFHDFAGYEKVSSFSFYWLVFMIISEDIYNKLLN